MNQPETERKVAQIRHDVDDLYVLAADIDGRLRRVEQTVDGHTAVLEQHTATLNQHTATLNQHTATLNQHTATLNEHSVILNEHTTTLDEHSGKLDHIIELLETR